MSTNEVMTMVEKLKEWEAIVEEATAEAESIKDAIKAEMTMQGVSELKAGRYTVRYTDVTSHRVDTAALKKSAPQIYDLYSKVSIYKKFTVVV